MSNLTLHQLRCFDAVLAEGSFQGAADKLCRSQPSVFAAVKNLESQVGVALLDRSGYRVTATDAGRSFHEQARVLLRASTALDTHAAQLAMGEETALHIVIGDLCPLAPTLGLLKRFFDGCPATRLHLQFEAISGPWERLKDGDADLIIHHIDKADASLAYIDLCTVKLIPVVAPGFLSSPASKPVSLATMRRHVQCIIRDTARHSEPRDYHVLEGARSWTVSDQLMKKEIIVQGMGWGHLPDFLINEELQSGLLARLKGRDFAGGQVDLVAARMNNKPHGPVAQRLWQFIAEQAPWGPHFTSTSHSSSGPH